MNLPLDDNLYWYNIHRLSAIFSDPKKLPRSLSEQEKKKIISCTYILFMYLAAIRHIGASENTSVQLAYRITELYEKYIKDVLKEGESDDADYLLSIFGEVAEYIYSL